MASDGICASAESYCESIVPSFKAHGSQVKLIRTGIKVMGTVRKLTSTIKILTYLSQCSGGTKMVYRWSM